MDRAFGDGYGKQRSRSLDPTFGFCRLTLEDQDSDERYQSPFFLEHSGQGEDISAQSQSGGREAPQLAIRGEEERARPERPRHLEAEPWYPRGGSVVQGPFAEDIDSPFLPQNAPHAAQPTPHLGFHQGVPGGPSRSRSNARSPPLPLPTPSSTLLPEVHAEGTEGRSGGPVSFRDIGAPEAEGRLRRAHNLPSGASLSLSGLLEPAVDLRPPHNYNLLVQLAIWESPERRLTLQEIYAAISNRFGYYRGTSEEVKRRWQGSIRHMLSNRDAFFRIRDTDQIGRGDHWEINFAGLEESRRQRRKLRKQRRQQHREAPIMEGFEDVQGQSFEESHHAASSSSTAAPSTSSRMNEALASTASLSGSVDRVGRTRYGGSASPRLSAMLRSSSSLSRNPSPALPAQRGEISGPVFLHPPSGQFPAESDLASDRWPAPQNGPLVSHSQAFDATLGGSSSLMRRHPTFGPPLSGAPSDPRSFYDLPSPAANPSSQSSLSSQNREEDPTLSQGGATSSDGKGKGRTL
ncbi:hypothetical protein PM082_011586 [Marasmius tenuissimus]|nr:hypothetical protein PM082_011586 [Marasmius tenuissimus]